MNYLLFDFEHGHQSLGSKEKVKEILNLPVLTPDSWGELDKIGVGSFLDFINHSALVDSGYADYLKNVRAKGIGTIEWDAHQEHEKETEREIYNLYIDFFNERTD